MKKFTPILYLLLSFSTFGQKNDDIKGTWSLYKVGDSTKHIPIEKLTLKDSVFEYKSVSYIETETVKRIDGKIISKTRSRQISQKIHQTGTYSRTNDELIFNCKTLSVTPKINLFKEYSHKYKIVNGELTWKIPMMAQEGDQLKVTGDSIVMYFRRKK